MRLELNRLMKIVAISLTALPASCGSFYASSYVGGAFDEVTACALECGEVVPSQSFGKGFLEFILIVAALGFVLLWAWLINKLTKEV